MKRHRSTLRAALIALPLLAGAGDAPRLHAQATDSIGLAILASLDTLRGSNPELYETTKVLLITTMQMALGRLGFGQEGFSGVLDSGTALAVERFETARRLPITGNLLAPATLSRLSSDLDRLTKLEQRPSLGLKTFSATDSWLMTSGPWILDGEPDTYMKVDIYCARDNTAYFGGSSTLGECRLVWARLGTLLGTRELSVLVEHFAIDRWDHAEVVSRPRDYPCVRYDLRINRLQETVVMTRSTLSQGDLCAALDKRDLVTRLGDFSPTTTNLGELINLGPTARTAFGLDGR